MDRIIRQITNRYVSQLPGGKEYYRIEELKSYHFPSFLIGRIHIELQWNLDESMILPKTDWANTDSERVQQAWQNFLGAIHAEVQLPGSYAKAVIETAVSDIVDMLVQPRQNIPDILFGGEDQLSAAELSERAELLVVYPHFAQVLESYMERKNMDSMSRERGKKIVARVDEKVTSQYTPLQWAQMLDPFFTLMGQEIDSDLLRLFFDDRNMQRTARRFDKKDNTITRAELIEVLSSPDPKNYEGYQNIESSHAPDGEGDDQENELVDRQKEKMPLSNKLKDNTHYDLDKNIDDVKRRYSDSVEPYENKKNAEGEERASKKKIQGELIEPEPNTVIGPEESVEETEESGIEIDESKDQSPSLNDIFINNDQQDDAIVSDDQPPTTSIADADQYEIEATEEEDSPIWMRFMDPDKADKSDTPESDWEPSQEDEYIGEPVFDQRDNSGEKGKTELVKRLDGNELYFIGELFNGSEQAYRQALGEIAEKDSWKEASILIKENIFDRNRVDIYSEVAIDFTDRLHDYFINKLNKN